ncbi:abortive infection family protein [Bradyrhizobium sp. P5_C11_2]
MFEAAHATIAPQLGVTFSKHDGFPVRMKGVIAALDFSVANHPDADKINTHVRELTRAIEDMAVALAKLSNIPNLRHGGSLDWGTLERQHAVMLGGLCDTLVSFLFDVAWRRPTAAAESEPSRYEDFAAFNASLDDDYEEVEIARSVFQPSKILYLLDNTRYELARVEWETEQAASEPREGALA